MSNLGLADWIAYDEESYVNNAVKAASNLAELAKVRIEIRETVNSALMDEKGFAIDVENAYLNMWKLVRAVKKLIPFSLRALG